MKVTRAKLSRYRRVSLLLTPFLFSLSTFATAGTWLPERFPLPPGPSPPDIQIIEVPPIGHSYNWNTDSCWSLLCQLPDSTGFVYPGPVLNHQNTTPFPTWKYVFTEPPDVPIPITGGYRSVDLTRFPTLEFPNHATADIIEHLFAMKTSGRITKRDQKNPTHHDLASNIRLADRFANARMERTRAIRDGNWQCGQ